MTVGGGIGQSGIKGEKWDNCNSIINKIYIFLKYLPFGDNLRNN